MPDRKCPYFVRLTTCLALTLAAISGFGCDRSTPAATKSAPGSAAPVPLDLDGTVVIGASVSDGAEVALPGLPPKFLAGDANLADVLCAATGKAGPVCFADMMFFMNPNSVADRQLSAAKQRNPKLVFALDYLFWHAYGDRMDDAARTSLFERGLERLASFGPETTIVVADLPDMSHAIGQPMALSKSQVPPVALQESLNRRLAEWAAAHPNVTVVPLRDTVAAAMGSGAVTLGGTRFEGTAARDLLTPSGLHATADGLIAVAMEALDRLKSAGRIPGNAVWERDPAVLTQRLVEAAKAARAADEAKRLPKPAGTGG